MISTHSRPRMLPIADRRHGRALPGLARPGGFWRDIVEPAATASPRCRARTGCATTTSIANPGTPDKVYATRGGFLSERRLLAARVRHAAEPCRRPTPRSCSRSWSPKRVLAEATRGKFESMDRSRMSVVLGVASATELVAQMVGRLQSPVCGTRDARQPGSTRPRWPACPQRASTAATCRGRRTRFLACSATWSLAASRTASISAEPTAVVDAACASSLAALSTWR